MFGITRDQVRTWMIAGLEQIQVKSLTAEQVGIVASCLSLETEVDKRSSRNALSNSTCTTSTSI